MFLRKGPFNSWPLYSFVTKIVRSRREIVFSGVERYCSITDVQSKHFKYLVRYTNVRVLSLNGR